MKERRIIRYRGATLKISENRWGGMEYLILMPGYPRIHDITDTKKSVCYMKWYFDYFAKKHVDAIIQHDATNDPKNWKDRFILYKSNKQNRKPIFRR